MRKFADLSQLREAVGAEIGVSDWLLVDQERVNLFAEATGDHQWIHIDPQRAAEGPFGGTIAHGYLTLSLLVPLMHGAYEVQGVAMGVNYGLNRVRFPAPLPVGSRIRGRVVLAGLQDIEGGVQATWGVSVEREGGTKPVCVAETVTRMYA
jgi:acyl dehydratase